MRKWLIILLLLVVAYIGYDYIYQEHRDIESEPSEFRLSSIEIANEFQVNPNKAEQTYLNKTIEITGNITEINDTEITIDNTVLCLFNSTLKEVTKHNQNITIKGRFIGYDDLLEQVKLDQCTIIN